MYINIRKRTGIFQVRDRAVLIFILVFCFTALPLFAQEPGAGKGAPAVENQSEAPEESGVENSEDPFGEKGPHFTFGGLYRDLLTFQRVDNYYGDNILNPKKKNLISNLKRIRLSPEFRYSDILILHVDYDNEIILSSFNKSREFNAYWRGTDYNDFFDLSWEPYYSTDVYYRTKIHRAYAKISVWNFTFTLGRQQIRFGSGRLWNPLDIMNPISPTFVEGAEDQKGTDAARIDYFINDTTELTLVSSQKKYNNSYEDMTIKDSNTILRLTMTVSETDISILGGWLSRRALAGIDVSSIIADGTLRGSALFSYPANGKYYFQASAGYEYTFTGGVYFLVEYFFNQNGLNFNDRLRNDYISSFINNGVRQENFLELSNQFLTFNQHYLGLALGYDITALLRIEFFTIYDFQGYGLFMTPSLKYNIRENVDIAGGIMFGYVFDGSDYFSDFESFNNHFMYYASVSLYF